MDKLFFPQSVAVIGASRHKEKLGFQLLDNLAKSGFKGKIIPVNPEAEEILGFESYRLLKEIPDEVDLAVIIVPAVIVPQILDDCIAKKVPYAIVISSGFSEMGKKGALLQKEIQEKIAASSLRVLGPNCLGIFNTENSLNATFAAPKLTKGKVAAVFQSGALGVALLDWAEKFQFGFSKFISLGNKVDLEESEIIEFLGEDKETKLIAVYLEEISNPAKFLEAARKVSEKKPIIILKGGSTSMGARAAFSHTAALVTPKHINEAIFSQANLVVVQTIEEMLDVIEVVSLEPETKSREVAIITNAGGPGILATDMAVKSGLLISTPNPSLQKKLTKKLPAVSSVNNPIDLTGEAKASDYEEALSLILQDKQFSGVVALLTPQTATEIEETASVLAARSKARKPVVASFLGSKLVSSGIEILKAAAVPNFSEPENAVKALAKASIYWQKKANPKNYVELEKHDQEIMPSGDALELVNRYNIPIPPSGMATTVDVAMKIVGRIGFPVAVKNISKNIVHKYKAGKVILNVETESYLKTAIKEVGFPVLIQRMVDSPFEIIIGAKRDANLGTLITFGWGGVFTEDIDDISLRILPLTEYDLDEMIKETKIGKVLVRENVDLSSLKNILIDVCQIMTDFEDIAELDLNPIKVLEGRAYCVDARYK